MIHLKFQTLITLFGKKINFFSNDSIYSFEEYMVKTLPNLVFKVGELAFNFEII